MHEKQIKILELGARLQYFTVDHLYQAGIYNTPSKTTARVHLRDLSAHGWLSESHYGVTRGLGRLPTLYGLTPKAARYLVDCENHQADAIKISKSRKNQDYETRATADYFHRVGLLDSVLSLLLFLDSKAVRGELLEMYFRRLGLHEPKRTAIELKDGRLEPDAILSFDADGRKRFYLIEFYEDSVNVERIRRAIVRHSEALHTGAPSNALGLSVGHRVLLVFRHEHTARAVMEYLSGTAALANVSGRFLFKTHESIVNDPFNNWANCRGERVNLY